MLASIGSVGDAYDNAMAESFVDSFKTELISDRVWRSKAQLELAIVEWVGWYNEARLHSALGDIPPVEHEQAHAEAMALGEAGGGSGRDSRYALAPAATAVPSPTVRN
ncbi:MAG: integrase core domain-containing protein [Solirubrobacteraceae bacterium]|nr:integrase core domain-containing protein [Solirubrobacteraceae bacterium]